MIRMTLAVFALILALALVLVVTIPDFVTPALTGLAEAL